jgi:hypothetical protein
MMWFLRRGFFRPFGPAWLAFAGYRYWKRLPAARKAEIKKRARTLATSLQRAGGVDLAIGVDAREP